jgi:hypothetical protein
MVNTAPQYMANLESQLADINNSPIGFHDMFNADVFNPTCIIQNNFVMYLNVSIISYIRDLPNSVLSLNQLIRL